MRKLDMRTIYLLQHMRKSRLYRLASPYLSDPPLLHGLVLVFAFVIVRALAQNNPFTGDETRYVYYAVSLFHTGKLSSGQSFGLPWPPSPAGPPWNAPFISVIGSPFIGLFGRYAGRVLAMLVTAIGVFSLHRLLTRRFTLFTSDIVIVFMAFGIPLFQMGGLFYTEGFAFGVISAAWLVSRGSVTARRLICGTILVSLLPFIHIRAALLGLVIGCLLIVRAYQESNDHRQFKRWIILIGSLVFVFAIAFIAFQLAIFGRVFGGFGAHGPDVAYYMRHRLSEIPLQFFYVRHGLVLYTPLFIIGLSGLLVALLTRRSRGDWEAAALFVAAFFPVMWPDAGECPIGRFWVLAVPSLAFGIAYWIEYARRGAAKWFILFVLGGVQAITGIASIVEPSWNLASRTSTMLYDELFLHFGVFKFGYLATAALADSTILNWMFAATLLFIFCMALGCVENRKVGRPAMIVAMAMVVAFLDVHHMHTVPARLVRVSFSHPLAVVTAPNVCNVAQMRIAGNYMSIGGEIGPDHMLTIESDHGDTRRIETWPLISIFPLLKTCGINFQYPEKLEHTANPFATMASDSILLRSLRKVEYYLSPHPCPGLHVQTTQRSTGEHGKKNKAVAGRTAPPVTAGVVSAPMDRACTSVGTG